MLKYKGIIVYDYKKTYDKYYDIIIKNINEKVDDTVGFVRKLVKDIIILDTGDNYIYFEVKYIIKKNKIYKIHYIKELTFEFIDAGKTVKVPMGKQKQKDYTRSKDTKKVRVSLKEKRK